MKIHPELHDQVELRERINPKWRQQLKDHQDFLKTAPLKRWRKFGIHLKSTK